MPHFLALRPAPRFVDPRFGGKHVRAVRTVNPSHRQVNAYSACNVKMPVAVKCTAATTTLFLSASEIFCQRLSQTSVLAARCSAWHRLNKSHHHVRTTMIYPCLHRSRFESPPLTIRDRLHTFTSLQRRILGAHHADIHCQILFGFDREKKQRGSCHCDKKNVWINSRGLIMVPFHHPCWRCADRKLGVAP